MRPRNTTVYSTSKSEKLLSAPLCQCTSMSSRRFITAVYSMYERFSIPLFNLSYNNPMLPVAVGLRRAKQPRCFRFFRLRSKQAQNSMLSPLSCRCSQLVRDIPGQEKRQQYDAGETNISFGASELQRVDAQLCTTRQVLVMVKYTYAV